MTPNHFKWRDDDGLLCEIWRWGTTGALVVDGLVIPPQPGQAFTEFVIDNVFSALRLTGHLIEDEGLLCIDCDNPDTTGIEVLGLGGGFLCGFCYRKGRGVL